jgi:hypothetical protein
VARRAAWVATAAVCLGCLGCSGSEKIVSGTVTFDGKKVDNGMIRFVPIEGTPGGAHAALIVQGDYRIDARGGLPIGKYRVVVEIYTVKETASASAELPKEIVPIGPAQYASNDSPLVEELSAGSDGRIDIDIPRGH